MLKTAMKTVQNAVRSPLTWLLFLALLFDAAYLLKGLDMEWGDSPRCLYQAESLCSGKGFVRHIPQSWLSESTTDRPETSLPPGYPILLAFAMMVSSAFPDAFVAILRAIQLALLLASCYFVFAAIRPRSQTLAIMGFLTLATFPPLHAAANRVLSEILTTFLCSAAVLAISRLETRGSSAWLCFVLGVLTVAILLCTPGLIILSFLIWCYVAWRIRRSASQLLVLTIGSLALMVPWQAHCYQATGSIVWTVYEPLPNLRSEVTRWYRTWATSEADLFIFWGKGGRMVSLPDDVFSSTAEREELTRLYDDNLRANFDRRKRDFDPEWVERGHNSRKQTYFSPPVEEAFKRAADIRIAQNPFEYYLILPLQRTVALWGHGVSRDSLTAFVYGGAANCVTLIILLTAAYWGLSVLRLRTKGFPLLVVLAVVSYTLLSVYTGFGEDRRNIPFYPIVIFTWFYLCNSQEQSGEHSTLKCCRASRTSIASAEYKSREKKKCR